MNDIIIKIDTKTAKAYCENNKIGVQHANLQNKLIFEMSEKINGSAWLEYEINGTKNYAEMEDTENGYQIDIKSCLLVSNNVNVDLKITESEDAEGIPIFISTIVELDVYDSINATTEEPEYYPDWKTVADSKIAEMNQLKEDVNEAITKTNNLNIDASKSGKVATVTLTKKDATTKTVTLSDGTNLMFNWDGTRLGIKTDEDEEYTYVDLIGPQGIQGEPGTTPNLTIGTVVTGNTSSATRTGTNENPIFNFVLEKGDKGDTGNGIASVTKTSTSGLVDTYTITYTNGTTTNFNVTNGKSITNIAKTSTSGLEDTYTITYNDNTTSTFTVTNGNGISSIEKIGTQDNVDTYKIYYTNGTTSTFTVTNSTVTNQEFEELKAEHEELVNTLPRVEGTGESITLDNTAQYKMNVALNPSELSQDGTPTPTTPIPIKKVTGNNTIVIENQDNTLSQSYPINLGSLEYCKIGNYSDEFALSTGVQLFDKNNANKLNAQLSDGEIIASSSNAKTLYIPIVGGTTYTVSRIAGKRFRVGTTTTIPTIGDIISNFIKSDTSTSIKVTTDINANYLCVYYFLNGTDTLTEQQILDSIMINEGSTALPWQPYGIGNWYLKKNIGKVVLDGTENGWSYSSQTHSVFYISEITNNIRTAFTPYSNYYLGAESVTNASGASNKGNNTVSFYRGSSETHRIFIINDSFTADNTGRDNFKAWLSTHNTIIYYVLETPTSEAITDTTLIEQLTNLYNQIKSYKGQTNITQTNAELPFNIDASALYDLNNLISRVATLEVEV